MLKFALSAALLTFGVIAAGLSYFYRLPVLVLVTLGWYLWLRTKVLERKGRILAPLGFGMTVIGWCVSWLERGFMLKVEGTHWASDALHWRNLAQLSFLTGAGLMLLGLFVLAYVDFVMVNKSKQTAIPPNAANGIPGQVWPPAPKRPAA